MIQQNISFIDEHVTVAINHSSAPSSKTYRYEVILGGSVIFEGNKYLPQGETVTYIDVTETLASVRWTPDWDTMAVTPSTTTTYTQVRGLIDRVTVRLYGTEADPSTYMSSTASYAGVYRYPHRLGSLEWTLPSPTMTSTDARAWNLIQGGSVTLAPHYPSMPAASGGGLFVTIAVAVYSPTNNNKLFMAVTDGSASAYTQSFGAVPQGFSTGVIQTRVSAGSVSMLRIGVGETSVVATFTSGFDVRFDKEPCRYYLMWQDRFGGFQSQPFPGTETFKESLTSREITKHNGMRVRTGADIKPSWSLNSGWLDATLYPFYESLLCSPLVVLTDTKEAMQYPVVVTDNSYTEKTFVNNGRKMFNLTINADLAKGQQMTF